MLEPGARVRDYEVWGRIGGGGMSDVWLARHGTLATPVVIKTLRAEVESDPKERLARLINEARLTARITSPHVVRALDVGMHVETPYLVQEYADGIDLNELDHRRRRAMHRGLPLWFVAESVAHIAEGLHAAHQMGVLHRDLKPSNLFGSPDGVKLGDFGIAVAKQIGERAAAETSGTLRFMAPEALRGEALDRRTDVFGLGATAFDLRYGRPPFPDPKELLQGRPRCAFPPAANPHEAFFQNVLARMLAYDREGRHRDLVEPRRLLLALARGARPTCRAALQADGSIAFGGTRIVCEEGDIAKASADGIVSSANYEMKMRSGVGDALRRRGGDVVEEEAMRSGQQPLGACVATGPGGLACKRVLHAVSAWEEASCIGRATQRALLMAEELGLRTLAIPALGTGAARVTLESSANAVVTALERHLLLGGSRIAEVRFVLFDAAKLRTFCEVAEGVLFGETDEAPDETGLLDGDAEGSRVSEDGPTLYVPQRGAG